MKRFAVLGFISSMFAIGPCPKPETDTCFRGGIPSSTCTGLKCPPCWIDQSTFWGCYEKIPDGNGQLVCPAWPKIIDITNMPTECKKPEIPEKPTDPPTETICPDPEDECYRGGMADGKCVGKHCPRCWKWDTKQWNCFDMVNNACPWSGMVDIMNRPKNCVLPYCS